MNPIVGKKSIRPSIPKIDTSLNTKAEELFQNEVLRPIIKLQHELLIAHFNNHLLRNKLEYSALNELEKRQLVEKLFQYDKSYKIELRALVIGHFTPEEFLQYAEQSAEFNKRILIMIKERLLSVI